MKKSSKQKKNNRKNSKKQQAKNQRRQQRKAKQHEQSADESIGIDAETAAQKRKAMLAQFRQTQWKQKVKASKASAAKVQKTYNRGG